MRKNYIAPQCECNQFGSVLMQDVINIIHHSGGTNSNGSSGFSDEELIW